MNDAWDTSNSSIIRKRAGVETAVFVDHHKQQGGNFTGFRGVPTMYSIIKTRKSKKNTPGLYFRLSSNLMQKLRWVAGDYVRMQVDFTGKRIKLSRTNDRSIGFKLCGHSRKEDGKTVPTTFIVSIMENKFPGEIRMQGDSPVCLEDGVILPY